MRAARGVTLVTLAAMTGGCAGNGPGDRPTPAVSATAPRLGPTPPGPTPGPTPPGPTPGASDSEPTPPRPTSSPRDQAALDARLRAAAWADDVRRARALVRRGADVNAKDETQQSAYLIATSEGHLALLRLALRSGARVNDKDSWNGTGLIRAAERGHWLVVGELLQAGIDRDHVNRIGYQAIHESIWLGEESDDYAATVRVLAAGGVELTRPSGSERLTPREMAQRRGNATAARTLARVLDRPPPVDPDAALLRAAAAGDADGVAWALRAGADVEARDAQRRTPLLLAAAGDDLAAARVLVALGASPNALRRWVAGP